MKIAVAGSSGFVGSEVVRTLRQAGHEVVEFRAPRLASVGTATLQQAATEIVPSAKLIESVKSCEALINAAGDRRATETDEAVLNGPNALLAGLLGKLCVEAGIPRYIHISSAAVQGDRAILDSSNDVRGFSPYARSKIAGERLALQFGPVQTVTYRPPSVHHETQRVTRQLYRIANSIFSSVSKPEDAHTPQALLESVGEAVLVLVSSTEVPPSIVHHPWDGLTTTTLLQVFSRRRRPVVLPRMFAGTLIRIGKACSVVVPQIAPYVRRVELVWFGQEQAESWLKLKPSALQKWQELATLTAQAQPDRKVPK